MKLFIFSIDDGTIYDRKVIDIFNKYGIKGTFNLNSGLDDFVWYLEDKPIRRLILRDNIDLYNGHEITSHSLTHPHMTMCPGEIIVKEVGEDIVNLEKMFNRSVTTFAFPFEDSDERCINIIKHIHGINTIRLSDIDTSYQYPSDLYHVKITSLDVNDALNRFDEFVNDNNAKLFVFVSHAYDFEVNNTYDKLEELCRLVSGNKKIKNITMNEFKNWVK